MTQTTKFTQEELDQIENLQTQNNHIFFELGQTEIQLFLVNEELEKLQKTKSTLQIAFKNFQAEEKELVDNLNKKYGTGTVDINTGEFIPEN